MTRKDYETLAEAIREAAEMSGVNRRSTDYISGFTQCHADIVDFVGDALATDNPRFDRKRFEAACGLSD